ncbi:MAG: 23S rRNA (adenine(2503)-C(2))-methyltransferase RlmN [Nitrospinaceae bacterium]|nr:23S rRNA (adenine(2503)-C(2))-methyltransferase RlmN [Nitrospina sp.]MBT5375231.1 23S rRNA (adenine(2503)-C(2))-methyltransferase RlmN [Nitrospinaceae bacterium]MBT5869819.1 23S rRNA (adenine(2503)-C(2))-methyltransferase RlmN [Nitrospinaceae bacterium]MBT6346935.1 23S rRNA (adenine(2503)-C(2))-methyltransferase RlmN [Nitrospina sp.]
METNTSQISKNFFGTSEQSLKEIFAEWKVETYRIHQVFTWVYHYNCRDFNEMTNLSKALRALLAENFYFSLPKIISRTHSQDGSIKYLLEMDDGAEVECVWMPSDTRKTLCISTQVGCRLNCSFCLTASLGLKRNLTTAEIIGQHLAINAELQESEQISNVVFMGMGEPLDNYDSVVEALRLMISPQAMKISTRKVTVSTSGLVDRMKNFQNENLSINLAISLNASDNATRDRLMPINKKYPIEVLIDCLKKYPLKPQRRHTIEYVLLAGINDSDDDAQRLAKWLRGVPCKINLIPFNSFDSSEYKPPSKERVLKFQNYLIEQHYSAFVRYNRATDILGACGQLAAQSAMSAPS